MGKRLTQQPCLKIAKKQPTHQFNNLIKVLKPKVYITNSSNFKNLVQELTGNGSQTPIIPSFSSPIAMPIASSEPPHVIEIDDDDSPVPSLEYSSDPSLEFSSDASLNYSPDPSLDNMFMTFDSSYCSSEELGSQCPQDRVMDYVNEMELRNLETWLLDFDPSAIFHDVPFVPMNSYEYEYNLPSIM